MAGVNAAAAGAPFTCTGRDQLRPPSEEVASAIPLRTPPLKRESSHTTYAAPVESSTAMEGSAPPVLTIRCVFGSTTVTFCTAMMLPRVCASTPGSKMLLAGSHVAPPSVVRANHIGPCAKGELDVS